MPDAVDEPIRESNPLRRYLVPALVALLLAALAVGALIDGGSSSDDEDGVESVTETTAPSLIAATVVFADGSTATVDRVQVESLTELIMGHEQYRVMSFTDPSESRVRTRVTRNLIVSEIVKHAAPEPVDPKIFALVRDEQFEQITFNLIDQDLETDRPGSRAREIIREMGPYVDLLASTLALSGDLPALPVLAGETTILVDSTIGRWDIETLDVIDIALREG